MRTYSEKIEFLYGLTELVNEVAVVAERRGSGEVGQLVLDIADIIAHQLGLPGDYRELVDEYRLRNGGLQAAMEEYPEA